MKKVFVMLLTMILFFLTGCEETGPSGPVPEPPVYCKAVDYEYDYETLTYNLIWSDEFDGDELNLDDWTYEVNGYGGGNNELQYYTDQNVVVEDGLLKIIAKKEEYLGREYTSSRINTDGKVEFRYGIVEISAKMPAGTGTWAALWMLPDENLYGGWPNSGEIDIMEYVGYQATLAHSTIHTKIYNHIDGSQKGNSRNIEDLTENFHTYKLEWLPDKIVFYIDDVKLYTWEPGKYVSCPEYGMWPFDRDFYLIFNIAIGGDWGGAYGVDDDIFPTVMEVDYVRVYQAEEFSDLD
jgi:beta-glucanase (GH16 family)